MNTQPPRFREPWTPENPFITVQAREGQPPGSYVTTLVATDDTDAIGEYRVVDDPQDFFDVDPDTGKFSGLVSGNSCKL